jgi:hypothetical protein
VDALELGEFEGFVVVEDAADVDGEVESAPAHVALTRPAAQESQPARAASADSRFSVEVGATGPCP